MKTFAKKCKHAVRWRMNALMKKTKDDNTEFNAVLARFINNNDAPMIFDVGAHRGESLSRFRVLFPNCVLHAFEPDEDNFEILSRNWAQKSGVTLNNSGVSDSQGKLTFYRNLKSNTSSFHAVNENSEWAKSRSARHQVSPHEFTVRTYDVPVIDLDFYAREHDIDRIHLLKIDTQGHEDQVLHGCRELLSRGAIDVIETELILGDAYVKSLQFYDLEKILVPLGYRLYGLDRGGNLLSFPALSLNALYVHQKFLQKP